jgi:hypothetical protein
MIDLAPSSDQKFVSLSQSSCVTPVALTDGRIGGGGGGGAKSYGSEKAMSSINHSVLIQVSEQKTSQKTFEMMNTKSKEKNNLSSRKAKIYSFKA